MAYNDPAFDGAHSIRLGERPAAEHTSKSSIAALRDYLEHCDSRRITPETNLFLSAEDRLTRDDILTALPLCINIIRIGTTLILPNGETFGRDDINSSLSVRLVLGLATLDETSREREAIPES